jgi:endoglucanase
MNQVGRGCLTLRQSGRTVLRLAACLIAIAACSHAALAQLSMLHASGRNIVNANGQTVILKGMNLGGYMVMEPWMCPADAGGLPDSYSIMSELDSRFGVAEEQALMTDYEQAWITTQDFVNIKNAGFNVVRVPVWWGNFWPLASQTTTSWRSDAFTQLDWIVNQAAAQGIYVIIDMHGVVGGQSTSDDTGQQNQNQYWTNTNDQGNTAWMWWEIANHYNGNANVAGYDLLNEPMNAPSDSAVISAMASLYTTVRSIDTSHIVIIEGTFDQWDWSMLPNPSSEGWTNVVYSMHEYQYNTTQAAVNAGAVNEVNEFNNDASYNCPDYIGEWNDMGYNSSYQYSYNLWNSNGISSTMWALKNDAPGSGWGMYTPSYTPPTPNVSTDSAATIAADWGQWTTANAFTLNTALGFTVSNGGGGGGPEGPYGGTPAAIPGTVMAENYDTGGQGTGYSVSSVNGSANSYRSDGVDLEAATSPATGDDLGWSASGQWFRYTVNVATAGTYTVSFLVASPTAVADGFHLSNSSGTNLSGSVNVPATGGYQTWVTVTANVTLPAGQQTLTLSEDAGGWNFDSMAFAAMSTPEGPYGGTPAAVPGTVMNENYDTGGQGTGYSVSSTNGSANSYRSDGIDLEAATSPATGNDLGWSAAAQWFRYTVNVASAGTYTVSFLVASPTAVADGFHLSNSSGTNLTGSVAVPATGGYQTWATVKATATLPAGKQTLTLSEDAGGWNIDSMAFASSSPTCTTKPSAPTGLAASGTTSSGTSLNWTADTAPANCSISSYSVLKNGVSIGTATGTSFAVSGLSASTTYSFTVEATDAAGTSAASSAVSVTTSASSGGEGPYPGPSAAAVPGTVMNENYDTGGQGVAYNVTSTNGTANTYRAQGVDLEAATAPATGNDLGWSAAGQWFRYTVNVSTAGTYAVSFLVASPTAVADAFHLSNSSGTNLSGSVAVPATGGYQTWVTVKANVTLPAGQQTLTLSEDAAGWNIDSMAFASSGGGGGAIANGTYTVIPQNATALRLDDEAASTATGNPIDVYTANGTAAQNWAFSNTGVTPAGYYNLSTEGAYCLTASGTTSGSAVVLDPCAGSSAQAWEAVQSGSNYIFHPANNIANCLDVSGAGTASGTLVQVYTCNGTAAQSWAL